MDHHEAGHKADEIIAGEVSRQDQMWGVANQRADTSNGQLLRASLAQAGSTFSRRAGSTNAFDQVPVVYPPDWSGFRDYGSDVANLAVAAAFLRQEIKRLITLGESTYRKPRDLAAQPYTADQPAVHLG